jgi:glycerol-3-phosphate dehydrogenase
MRIIESSEFDFEFIHAPSRTPKINLIPDRNAPADQCFIITTRGSYTIGKTDEQILKHYEELKTEVSDLRSKLERIEEIMGENEY